MIESKLIESFNPITWL